MLFQEPPSSLESKCLHPSAGNSVHLRTCMRTFPRTEAEALNSFTLDELAGAGVPCQRQAGREQGVSSEDPTSDLQLLSPMSTPWTEAKKESRF